MSEKPDARILRLNRLATASCKPIRRNYIDEEYEAN